MPNHTRSLLIGVVLATGWLMASPSAEGEKAPAKLHMAAVPRMPDGRPDLRGAWTKTSGTFNEATRYKAKINAECGEFYAAKAEPEGFNNVTGPRAKPQHAPAPGRKQGIVNPADRVLPLRPEALARRAEWAEKMGPPAASLEYIELSARCVPPGPWQGGAVHILQRPGQVVLLFEGDHGSRVIFTDGRPHPAASLRLFGGDSVGRWEGDTLVVDTTNLVGLFHLGIGQVFAPFSERLHLTERFTMEARDLIDYEIVYDDPLTFTKPVKVAGYLYPADDNYDMVELTCTEGSSTLRNIFGF